MSFYTHHSSMDAPQCVHVDVNSDFFSHWIFYYTHHRDMYLPQYVYVDVTSDYSSSCMTYYTHHTGTYVPRYVSPVERKKKVILLFFKKVVKNNKMQITNHLHKQYITGLVLSNSIKYHKCSWLLCVNNTWIKCPISSHKTPVQNDVRKRNFTAFLWRSTLTYVPLKISYHYISSITNSTSKRHRVFAGCASRTSLPLKWHLLVITKHQNGITTLCCLKSQKTAGLKTCSISVWPSVRKMPNVYVWI